MIFELSISKPRKGYFEFTIKHLLLCFLLTCAAGNSLLAQSKIDTLKSEEIHKITQLSQFYSLPAEHDSLDHFIAYFSFPDIDPFAVYNYGNDFLPITIENFNQLSAGNKLSIQAYTKNTLNPGADPVKLPRKDFYIK